MRFYELQLAATAVTASTVDLAEINAASAKSYCLVEVRLGQTTELTDAADEEIEINWVTGNTTSGSGGNSPTALPVDLGDAAFGGTCETFNTTAATSGTTATRKLFTWKLTQEGLWLPIPEKRIWMPGATRGVLRIGASPADSVTISGTITIAEVG